jgi:hypothetical protein
LSRRIFGGATVDGDIHINDRETVVGFKRDFKRGGADRPEEAEGEHAEGKRMELHLGTPTITVLELVLK